MSIATVVTMGYGTFGSVNSIPWLGFGLIQVDPGGVGRLEYSLPSSRMEFVSSGRMECAVGSFAFEYSSPVSRGEFAVSNDRLEYTEDYP